VNHRQSQGGFSIGLQPTQAWIAILTLVMFSALCLVAGASRILRLAFPMGSFAVGMFLYQRYPILYIGFTWWIWFLTPWLRRLIDYRSGWDEQPIVLLSPFLVTFVTFTTLLQHLPRAYRQGSLPFVLAFIGVFYGLLVGLINNPPLAVARAFLEWLTPILFGFHLFIHWRHYPSYRQNIQRIFLWGVLIMGVYGVLQYLVAPEWDRFWLINVKAFGSAEPLTIRVFSTVNSPGPFAIVMMAGLLLLFNSQEALRIPAAAAGYLAFLLTLVRSAWGGWFVGLVTLIASLKAHLQMRLIITILVMAVFVFPLVTIPPFSEIITSRLQSISNIKDDQSLSDRSASYDENLSLAFSQGLGKGIGSTFVIKDGKIQTIRLDSAILNTFFTLGWFGSIPYLGGILLLLFDMFQSSAGSLDPFASASRSITLSIFVQLMFGDVLLGLNGMVLWSFLAMSLAANKYYRHQKSITPANVLPDLKSITRLEKDDTFR
jgi:hypothetical protein